MVKVFCVFGTRPEAIKLAPVIRQLQQRSADGRLRSLVCVTAQHRQMLDQVLRLFDIVPDYDLNVMEDNQSATQVAAAVLARLEPILQAEQPDWVLVQGDTTTVAAASLAAFYAGVKVGHVEAGLRTGDKWRPFPEEINRRVAGVIADLHFAPTERARQNLLREGVPAEGIIVTGNPVIDALHWVVSQPPSPETCALLDRLGIEEEGKWKEENGEGTPSSVLHSPSSILLLVTAHRRENKVAATLGLEVEVRNLENPRQEMEEHYYNPDHQYLFDLGYKPTHDVEAEMRIMLQDLLKYRDRIEAKREVLISDVRWDGRREKVKFLEPVPRRMVAS